MTDDITPEKIRALIEAEEKALADVAAFVREGMRARRISDENGEALIDQATTQCNASVGLLRQLLGQQVRRDWQA